MKTVEFAVIYAEMLRGIGVKNNMSSSWSLACFLRAKKAMKVFFY